MSTHCILTAPSLQTHPRKGREGKGNRKGELRDVVPIHCHLSNARSVARCQASPSTMDGRSAASIGGGR